MRYKKTPNSSYLLISSNKSGKVFEIDSKGRVWWMNKGVFTQAKVDKEVAIALGKALVEIVEIYGLGKK